MSLKSPLVIIGVVLGAAVVAQFYFVLPEIRKESFDIAATQWFVFCPLYLFVKRKWTSVYLSVGQQIKLDICISVIVHLSLAYIAVFTPRELLVRVVAVWACCMVLSFVTIRSSKKV